MLTRRLCPLLFATLLITPFTIRAEEPSPLDLQLVSEVESIRPGEVFTVGLKLEHAPEHHTYWKYQGIVGVPTQLEWELPEGFQADEIQWEIPEHVDMQGHPAYGYKRDVLLLVDVTPPDELEEGTTVTLKAEASWMCCSAKGCYPGFTDLSLTLPVTNQDEPKWHPEWRERFEATRAKHPTAIEVWSAEARILSEDQVALTITPDDANDYPEADSLSFFSSDGMVASNKPHEIKRDREGRYHFILPRNPFGPENPQTMSGVLVSESGGWPDDRPAVWIEAPVISSVDEPREAASEKR